MLDYLLALLYLVPLAQGTSANATSPHSCPPLDETGRSVWSILGTCGITILICVWHTIHFDVPKGDGHMPLWWKILCGIGTFFVPEMLVVVATQEWWAARDKVEQFRKRGYAWSMTHSFFAEMGGFAYSDRNNTTDADKPTRIKSIEFLDRCEENKIVNPFITVKDIKDKSKSDWLGMVILTLQLIWFMLQVIVRGSQGLAVTLIELDTVCMGVLSLIVIVFWWHKPLGVGRPYVFYSTQRAEQDKFSTIENVKPPSGPGSKLSAEDRKALSNAWEPEPMFPTWLTVWLAWAHQLASEEKYDLLTDGRPSRFSRLFGLVDEVNEVDREVEYTSLWSIIGGLHLIAWNFEFPTETEKILWRVTSLSLTASPFFYIVLYITLARWRAPKTLLGYVACAGVTLGIVYRAMLVGLMLASLRALPCSAHQNVTWTIYIPHL